MDTTHFEDEMRYHDLFSLSRCNISFGVISDLFRKAERFLQKVGTSTRRAGGEEATVGANVQRR